MSKTISIAIVLVSIVTMATEVTNADFIVSAPTNLGDTVNSPVQDFDSSISPDGLSLYFGSDRPGGSGAIDLWVTTRATISNPWEQPVNLGPTVNSSSWDSCPSISADGLSLYFESNQPGGVGDQDIWVTSRPTPDSDWPPPVNLGPTVNSSSWDSCPSISADGLSLYFDSRRPGGSGNCDLWVTTRATISDPWEQPVNLGPTVNSSAPEYQPGNSADGLILFFFSNRSGGSGSDDIWVTNRPNPDSDWPPPMNLGPTVNSSARDICPYISADGSTLYLTSERPGGQGGLDLWHASIDPVVDLNGDGIVDAEDLCIVVDNWGTDNSLCDVGPMPWGDGIVDVEDLIVLAEHLFEEVGSTDDDISERVIERRISASSDDAEEALNPGYTNWNYSSDLELVHDRIDNGGEQLVGMTFRDIDVAPGEVINNAYIEFVCDEIINGTTKAYFLIWGHLTPNSEGFVEPYVISDRPRTVTQIPWEPDTWSAVGQKIQTVNIAPVIQELIDQEGWIAGNAIEIIIGADPDKPGFAGVRCAESYEGSASSAPLLHIEISQ